MRTTTLGATDLEVSRVCFGTWAFGGNWGPVDRPAAVAAVRRARELGINVPTGGPTPEGHVDAAGERRSGDPAARRG